MKSKIRFYSLGEYSKCKSRHIVQLCALFVFLFSFFSLSVSAKAIAQQEKVSLQLSNVELKTLFEEIQKQTHLYFMYNEELCSNFGKVNVSVKNKPVAEVLNHVFENTGLYCRIENNIITIKNRALPQETVTHKITGKVTDKKGTPLPGVTVLIEGTTIGVATDQDGKYVLQMPDKKDLVLVFSFMGMKKHKEIVKGRKVINVTMEEDMQQMEEVVVTGIFERKASSFTGSATTVNKEQLMRVGNHNLFQSLKNIDPSLMIFDDLANGSDPNKLPSMQLRGTSSFPTEMNAADLKGNYTNDPNLPLFILDGFEATVEKIFDMDVNRIESVTILKDAAAKAIYGSKAANGVVIVETKSTSTEDLLITYSGSVDVTVPDLTSYNLCDAREKLQVELLSNMYDSETDDVSSELQLKQLYNRRLQAVESGVNTDWLAKPLQVGVGHKHNLSVELGNKNLRLILDIGYNKVTGVMKGSDRTTISGQASMSYRHKNFNFKNILSITANNTSDSPYGSFGEYSKMNPYWSPVDEYGNLVKNADVVEGIGWGGTQFFANPLYNSTLDTKLETEYVDITNNLYVEWFIKEGLKATLRFGITKKHNTGDTYYPANHLRFEDTKDILRKGSYQVNEGDTKKLNGDFNINYFKQFGEKHYIFANVGWNVNESIYEEVIYKAEGFPSDRMNSILFARKYAKDQKPTGMESTVRDLGVLGVFNYSYDERYLLDLSYRANASSQFGSNNRWGSFWSVGLGYNLHNEAFMKQNGLFDQLKIRGSIGYTGSQGFDPYQSMATYTYNLDKTYGGFLGAGLMGMPNKDLKWQKKMDYNVGFDLSFQHKLSLKFDYYASKTDNTLIDYTLPTSTGFTSVQENVGEIKNTGVEMRLNWTLFSNPAERTLFSINTALAHNKNKIVKISEALKHFNEEQDKNSADKFSGATVVKYYEGMSMNAIWACRSLGIDPANGREVYLDKNGRPTYEYSPANLVVVGDELPKISGNFGFNAQYKGFELNCAFRYQMGAKMYNQTLVDKVEGCDLNYNVDKRVLEGRWQKPGDRSQFKALPKVWVQEEKAYKVEKTYPTSRFVQKRNELDLSSISLAYDFYRWDFIKKSGLDRVRLSFYMNDVYKWSSIKVERGLDYPFARSFNFSLQATF